jgi:hypothetical protein
MNELMTLVFRPVGAMSSTDVQGTIIRKTKTLVEVSFEHPNHPGCILNGTFSLKTGKRVRADVYNCQEWWLKSY